MTRLAGFRLLVAGAAFVFAAGTLTGRAQNVSPPSIQPVPMQPLPPSLPRLTLPTPAAPAIGGAVAPPMAAPPAAGEPRSSSNISTQPAPTLKGEVYFAVVLTPLLNSTVQPPTPQAGPASTPPPAGTCGCPHITPLATSDKPDPRTAEFEFSANDMDWTFSNRLVRFDGNWEKTRLDLAHAIDPDGSLQLWTAAAPTPSAKAAVLVEGDLTKFLISGPPDAATLPPAPYPLPGRDPHVAMRDYLYGPARIQGLVMNLLTTMARADKYGEPAFGVRDAALNWLRFLIEDLARMPQSRLHSSPAADRVILVRDAALLTMQGIIEQAVRPDPRWRELPRFARIHTMLRNPKASPATDAPPTGPALDIYDLSSAALDVFLSVDRNKKIAGLTDFMGRPQRFDKDGIPISEPAGPLQGSGNIFINRAMLELAALHARFGGPAPAGSPAEAVACKTLSILIGLADRNLSHSAAFRRTLWAYMAGDLWYGAESAQGRSFERRFRALRAASLLVGLRGDEEPKLYAPYILARAEQSFIASRGPGPITARFRQATIDAFRTVRDVNRYATGPGRAGFTAQVEAHFARVRSILAAVQAAREPGPRELAQLVPTLMRYPEPSAIPPIMDKGNRAGLLASLQEYLALWDQSAPDISVSEWQALCPPKEAPPAVQIYARGPEGLIILDKLYQNVPLMLGVIFAEQSSEETWPLGLQTSGGRIDLVARRQKDMPVLYLTDPFVLGGS